MSRVAVPRAWVYVHYSETETEMSAYKVGGPYCNSSSIQLKLKPGFAVGVDALSRKQGIIILRVLFFKLRALGTNSFVKCYLSTGC